MIIKRKIEISEMVRLRKQGKSFREIAKVAGVTPAWVGQAVRSKLPEEEDPVTSRAKKKFTGTALRPGVRSALEHMSARYNESLSEFIAKAVEQRILSLGGEIIETKPYNGEPLPFEERA